MKLNRIKRRNSSPLILEMTPLIDVVFLLLIFFLKATTFNATNSGIKIDLPTSTVKIDKPVNEIQITVTKNKEIYISYKENGKAHTERTNFQKLREKLKIQLEKSKDKNVIISADKAVSHGVVVDVMTASKEAGALSLDIDTAATRK